MRIFKIIIFIINTICIAKFVECKEIKHEATMYRLDDSFEGCYYEGIKNGLCYVECIDSKDATIYNEAMEYFKLAFPDCDDIGFHWYCTTPMFFNYVMTAKWFTANVTIRYLEIGLRLNDIQPNAFLSKAFETITHLTLNYVDVDVLQTGVFNGLIALNDLNINLSRVYSFGSNLLESSKNTLSNLKIKHSLKSRTFSIDGLTGNVPLSALKIVDFSYNNLSDTIQSTSFMGLIAVEHLDLSNAHITILNDNTFDPMAETIKSINLKSNLLKSLPENLFTNILINVIFHFDNNPFICDCNLMTFKCYMIEFGKHFANIQNIKCNEPSAFKNTQISISNFCPKECQDVITTPKSSPSSSLSTTPITTITSSDVETTTETVSSSTISPPTIIIECVSYNDKLLYYEYVSIHHINGLLSFEIRETKMGDKISIVINNKIELDDIVLLYHDTNVMFCLTDLSGNNITINHIQMNVAYLFCLMNKNATTVSPLNCLSYYAKSKELPTIWLTEYDKIYMIIGCIITIVLSLLLSICIGMYLQKYLFGGDTSTSVEINETLPDIIRTTEYKTQSMIDHYHTRGNKNEYEKYFINDDCSIVYGYQCILKQNDNHIDCIPKECAPPPQSRILLSNKKVVQVEIPDYLTTNSFRRKSLHMMSSTNEPIYAIPNKIRNKSD